tara:strand:- start:374 stop:583 length:210 start_codon:yes stop_codon:yes gene_type:complete
VDQGQVENLVVVAKVLEQEMFPLYLQQKVDLKDFQEEVLPVLDKVVVEVVELVELDHKVEAVVEQVVLV